MAKDKSRSGVKNRHIHARVSYLHQAATILTNAHAHSQHEQQSLSINVEGTERSNDARDEEDTREIVSGRTPSQRGTLSINTNSSHGVPLYLSSHLSQVARKSQIRLAPEVKHSICKRCGTIQLEGNTCQKVTENLSRGSKKSHADVLVQECGVCGATKRWPVGAQRQNKKGQRMQLTADAKHESQSGAGAADDKGNAG